MAQIKTEFDYKITEQKYCIVKIRTNKKYNIVTEEFVKESDKLIKKIEKDESIRSVIITSEKQSFATGIDINIFRDKNPEQIRKFAILCNKYIDSIENSSKIFIAAVDGYCLGGGLEMLMAMDYVIATPSAVFGLPEIKIGIIPGAGGIKRLVREVGRRRAMDLLLTGRNVSAKEALAIGLVNEIVPGRKLIRRAEEIARDISSKNPLAIKATKRLANKATSKDITKEEIDEFIRCLSTEPAKSAIQTFLDKTKS